MLGPSGLATLSDREREMMRAKMSIETTSSHRLRVLLSWSAVMYVAPRSEYSFLASRTVTSVMSR